MTRRILGCVVLTLFISAPCRFVNGQQAEYAQSKEVQREIPFEIVNGHLIEVRGSIGDHAKLRFLVEVGTPRTMLDSELGQRDDDAGNTNKTKAPASVQQTEVLLKDFLLGSIAMPEIRVISTDLSQMPAVPRGVAGIIGLDILQQQNVTIDYLEKKIFLSARTSGEHEAPIIANEVGLTVESNWKGSPLKLVLSTGVEAVALDQDRVSQRAIKLPDLQNGSFGDDKRTSTSIFEMKELVLGDAKLTCMGVVRKIEWPGGSEQLMGFLPLAALRARRVSLDFEKKVLFWDASSASSEKAKLASNRTKQN